MSWRPLFRLFTSARVTVALLCLLAVFLLLGVALPQAAVLGEERFGRLVEESPGLRFLLVTLGLGRMSTSPLFLAVLLLFFLNLAAVLLARLGPTWRRVGLKARSPRGLETWARMEESLEAPLPESWSPGLVARVLLGFGYQVRRPGERIFWGVKHRTAPIGFLLFHVSFFLLCAGGVLIYYTRFVGSVLLSEGQEFSGAYSQIERQSPLGRVPALSLVLEEVETRFEGGEAVHLEAVLRIRQAGSSALRRARINDPARWGAASILVQRAGLSAVLWLQDARGFTVDRVVAPVVSARGAPTAVPMGDERWTILLHPLEADEPFPSREGLRSTRLRLQVVADERLLFDGRLRQGEAAPVGDERLVLEELRYWTGIRVVAERGGGLLITGFVVGVVGLVWRLLWYRREVALTWDEAGFHLVGRSEYFTGRFQEELEAISSTLARPTERTAAAPSPPDG